MRDTNDVLFELLDDVNKYLDLGQLKVLMTTSTTTLFAGIHSLKHKRFIPHDNNNNKEIFDPTISKLPETDMNISISNIIGSSNINFIDKSGGTYLTSAIQIHGDIEMVKLLIKNGADVNFADVYGQTPLFLAIHISDHKIVELLIKENADVNEVDKYGRNPLHTAIDVLETSSLSIFTFIEHGIAFEIVKLLISEGTIISHESNNGETPLRLAATNDNIEMVKLLIEEGEISDVDSFFNWKKTPIMLVTKEDNRWGYSTGMMKFIENFIKLN